MAHIKIDQSMLDRKTAVMSYRTSAVEYLLGGIRTSHINQHHKTYEDHQSLDTGSVLRLSLTHRTLDADWF